MTTNQKVILIDLLLTRYLRLRKHPATGYRVDCNMTCSCSNCDKQTTCNSIKASLRTYNYTDLLNTHPELFI